MKAILLLSLLAVSLHATPVGQRDQSMQESALADQTAVVAAADEESSEQCEFADSQDAAAPARYMDVVHQFYNQLLPHVQPFGCGVMGGAGFACFETEIINPIVSHLLKGYSDMLVIAAEAGIIGGAVYMAHNNYDGDIAEDLKEEPATVVGLLAGLIAWYHLHG